MARKKKEPQNYFEVIPKPKTTLKAKDAAFKLCKRLSKKTEQRRKIAEEIREQRRAIYNLSLEIAELHKEIEEVF